jgi:hypothetical protein
MFVLTVFGKMKPRLYPGVLLRAYVAPKLKLETTA